MCGVAGVFAYSSSAPPVDVAELERTSASMVLRGPDGSGTWVAPNGRVGLAHRRLSIVDLSAAGAQPMWSLDRRYCVVFNGEIYNYAALREAHEQRGRIFASHSDTEILLHLYAERGVEMVDSLRGMFAFGIWDESERSLFLARDSFGIKPLYYADDGATLRFASQVKALLSGGGIATEQDQAAWSGFFLLGSVPEPLTTTKAIRSLPAGCSLMIESGGRRELRVYSSPASIYAESEHHARPAGERGAQEQVRGALLDSVSCHLMADVPVGAFLSGGTDSGALVGLMRDCGVNDLQTVTLAFREFAGSSEDETRVAEEIARTYGTRHSTRIVDAEEFRGDLGKIVDAMDQPTIDGINSWFVSKAAHELGLKVVISGLGGDELFGGYPSFRTVPRLARVANPLRNLPTMRTAVRQASHFGLSRLGLHPKLAGIAEFAGSFAGAYLLQRGLFMPWELHTVLGKDEAREGLAKLDITSVIGDNLSPQPADPFHVVSALESSLYMRNQLLRDIDWASMAHSLEVRVPLVDRVLWRNIAPLASSLQRGFVKQDLFNSPSKALPQSVRHPKTGFGIPVGKWLEDLPHMDRSTKLPAGDHWSRRWSIVVRDLFGKPAVRSSRPAMLPA